MSVRAWASVRWLAGAAGAVAWGLLMAYIIGGESKAWPLVGAGAGGVAWVLSRSGQEDG